MHPSTPTGMGVVPITFCEIESWQNIKQVRLNSWELITVRQSSYAYVTQSELSKDPKCICPIKEYISKEDKNMMLERQFKEIACL
jgi:hypothetical protein